MKDYTTILKDIKKAGGAIEKMQEDVKKLDFTEERRQAAKNGGYFNNKGYKELYDAAQANADAIRAYSEAVKNLEKQRRNLCELLPVGLPTPDYIKDYSITF